MNKFNIMKKLFTIISIILFGINLLNAKVVDVCYFNNIDQIIILRNFDNYHTLTIKTLPFLETKDSIVMKNDVIMLSFFMPQISYNDKYIIYEIGNSRLLVYFFKSKEYKIISAVDYFKKTEMLTFAVDNINPDNVYISTISGTITYNVVNDEIKKINNKYLILFINDKITCYYDVIFDNVDEFHTRNYYSFVDNNYVKISKETVENIYTKRMYIPYNLREYTYEVRNLYTNKEVKIKNCKVYLNKTNTKYIYTIDYDSGYENLYFLKTFKRKND